MQALRVASESTQEEKDSSVLAEYVHAWFLLRCGFHDYDDLSL